MIVLQVTIFVSITAGWVWLAFRGIPSIVNGLAEVRANWDNPDFWDDPDWSDDKYWDDELHRLLLEENDPADDWAFLFEEGK